MGGRFAIVRVILAGVAEGRTVAWLAVPERAKCKRSGKPLL